MSDESLPPQNVLSLDEKRAAELARTRLLMNYFTCQDGKKDVQTGLPPEDLYRKFRALSPDWPKVVGEGTVVVHEGRLHEIKSACGFFAWMQGNDIRIDWHSKLKTAMSKSEFHDLVALRCERFSAASRLPHFPPMGDTLYFGPEVIPSEDTEYLDELLNFFQPATEVDKILLKAAVLTPFWGGTGGQRPAFVITGKDGDELGGRGIGKTALVDVIGNLAGGVVEMSAKGDIDDFKKRLLTLKNQRVVRLDNIKGKLNSADLEALITAPYISGHRMYHGDGSIPNLFTYFMTFNDISFSRDMAQRAIPIVLNRPDYGDDWETRVYAFLEGAREDILRDIAFIFSKAPSVRFSGLRFSSWAKYVLARVTEDQSVIESIKTAQTAVDDDSEQADSFDEVIAYHLSQYKLPEAGVNGMVADPERGAVFLIRKGLVYQWLRDDLKIPPMSNQAMARLVRQARVPNIKGEHRLDTIHTFVYYQGNGKFNDLGQDGGDSMPAAGYFVSTDHKTSNIAKLTHLRRRT